MTTVRFLRIALFLALAYVLTYGVVAQTAGNSPAAAMQPKVAKVTVNVPVTLTDNGDNWTMDNGMLSLTINKRNGSMAR